MSHSAENPLFTFTEDERAYLRESRALALEALSPFATRDEDAIYEFPQAYDEDTDLVRPAFVRDVDRVLNNAFYNRCMDKTQVFPFYRNDDLTRRSFHLQLVSQVSRKIGTALRLNIALIEAIALGHDMGHTPFGHGGEYILNDLCREASGRCFNHNVQSVRLLRTVAGRGLSLQTLNGMLTHCGEKAFCEYRPAPCLGFEDLDAMMERCYTQPGASQDLRPNTLEGCVVRICDILAYIGKDRQDAKSVGVLDDQSYYIEGNVLGRVNAEFIRNASSNIIKNSIGRDCLAMDEEVFAAILAIKDDNSAHIYHSSQAHETLDSKVKPMMETLFWRFLDDLKAGDESSYVFRHHIDAWPIGNRDAYLREQPVDIVADYIAAMTDEYLIDLFNLLYPERAIAPEEIYVPYF